MSERLEDKLAEIRDQFKEKNPAWFQVIQRLAAELEETVVGEAIDLGDAAPDLAAHKAGTDETVRLSEVLKRSPVVLCFYRGNWCPYCRLELQGLQQALPEIEALGAEIFFVGPETEDGSVQMMDKASASIPILHDSDGAIMEAYRLAFEIPDEMKPNYERLGFPDANPGTGWRIPVPATYVIDRSGIVRARYVNGDYTRRMEPADIIAALREINESPEPDARVSTDVASRQA